MIIGRQSKNGKLPCVLLHGWGISSVAWQLVLASLEQHFDVYLIDLPGFGENANDCPEPYNLDTLAGRIAPLIPDGALVVGWSLGGLVATRIATLYPHKVASLCLVCSSPCFIEQANWPGIKANVLADFAALLCQDSQKTIERFLAIQAMGSEHARDDIKWLKTVVVKQQSANIKALSGGLEILQQADLRNEMAQLNIPIRGIYGRLDSLVPRKSIDILAASLVDFDYTVLNKASHAPFISHKDEFIRVFNGYFDG